jgi:hypothetical protein
LAEIGHQPASREIYFFEGVEGRGGLRGCGVGVRMNVEVDVVGAE